MMKVNLPFADFKLNAAVLEEITLAKTNRSAVTILKTIMGKDKGWQWHPGVSMWQDHVDTLAQQAFWFAHEWKDQGFPDHWTPELKKLGLIWHPSMTPTNLPWWWGHQRFHDGEKSDLIRYRPDWYQKWFKGIKGDLCEWWPQENKGKFKYGPQPAPDLILGDQFAYTVDGHPIYLKVNKMPVESFVKHANMFHNLMPDLNGGVPEDLSQEMYNILCKLHDRFHTKRMYNSHDHT